MKIMKATIYVVDDEYDRPEERLRQELEMRGFEEGYVLEDIQILSDADIKNLRKEILFKWAIKG